MPIPFLDANVLLRHLLGDHADQSPRATEVFARIRRGDLRVRTSETVVLEVVFTLERRYRQPRPLIRGAVMPLIELRGIELPAKRVLHRAFELYVELNLPFGDAHHAALMEQLKLTEILSFDKDFDLVPGIQRIEP